MRTKLIAIIPAAGIGARAQEAPPSGSGQGEAAPKQYRLLKGEPMLRWAVRAMLADERITQILFPGFTIKLYPDEAEGYIYNITSPQPKVFVMWRAGEDGIARPESLSVSYHEGARWMDAEETVGGVALPPDLLAWIGEFGAAHYQEEPKKKKRYASSRDKGVGSHRDGIK